MKRPPHPVNLRLTEPEIPATISHDLRPCRPSAASRRAGGPERVRGHVVVEIS